MRFPWQDRVPPRLMRFPWLVKVACPWDSSRCLDKVACPEDSSGSLGKTSCPWDSSGSLGGWAPAVSATVAPKALCTAGPLYKAPSASCRTPESAPPPPHRRVNGPEYLAVKEEK